MRSVRYSTPHLSKAVGSSFLPRYIRDRANGRCGLYGLHVFMRQESGAIVTGITKEAPVNIV